MHKFVKSDRNEFISLLGYLTGIHQVGNLIIRVKCLYYVAEGCTNIMDKSNNIKFRYIIRKIKNQFINHF